MVFQIIYGVIIFLVLHSYAPGSVWAGITISSQSTVEVSLVGFSGLDQYSLFEGIIAPDRKYEVQKTYRGLALLILRRQEKYPVIIGDEPFNLTINGPGDLPTFTDDGENTFFYQMLSGEHSPRQHYDYAVLMVEAKELLESSQSILSTEELHSKNNEFHQFVRNHYDSLKHSDMIRRLIEQYFMMHEYIDYYTAGSPAISIKIKYQEAILEGVGNWLELLQPYVPKYRVLNYIISLYYERSMVTIASLIIDNNKNAAFCPGDKGKLYDFPNNLIVTEANGKGERRLGEIKGEKTIAFVSEDCPVSIVETIYRLRQSANKKNNAVIIVAPLQKLSSKHFAMDKMVDGKKMLYINDEKWRKEHLSPHTHLPSFLTLNNINDGVNQGAQIRE